MNHSEYGQKMTDPKFNFDPDDRIDFIHGYYMLVGSIVSFGLLNLVVSCFGKPKSVTGESWRWNNLVISWVHGLICGSWDIACLYLYPELINDLVYHINYFTYLMVAFSTGYFIYDFLDLLFRGKIISNWEVTLHHVAVASMFWYNVHCEMCIGYNVLALMAEINSFFLHSRKLLHMLNYKFDNLFYRVVCMLNLLTFFFCRGYSLMRITYGMTVEYHLVPPVYFRCLCASIFVMNVINPILFWRLLKNDLLRNWGLSGKKLPVKTHMNGNNNTMDNHVKAD